MLNLHNRASWSLPPQFCAIENKENVIVQEKKKKKKDRYLLDSYVYVKQMRDSTLMLRWRIAVSIVWLTLGIWGLSLIHSIERFSGQYYPFSDLPRNLCSLKMPRKIKLQVLRTWYFQRSTHTQKKVRLGCP